MTSEKVRLRLFFDDRQMLSKSKKKEGLKRCWFLLKPHLNTISDLASNLKNTFRLHRTCPNGIILSMDGFVLPSFESTCILKDKDIVCVKRKGSLLTHSKPAMLSSQIHENPSIGLPKLLSIEGLQEERGEYETVSLDDDDDNDQSDDVVYVESKSGNAISKKRKASKKLKSPSQKKIKMSTTENLAVIPEVRHEDNGSLEDLTDHQPSLAKKDIDKSPTLSSQTNKSSNPDLVKKKKKKDKSRAASNDTRSLQPQEEGETKKLPSRSARRKKAKRKWLRELKLEKEKLNQSQVLEKDDQQLQIKDNNCIVSVVHQQSDEESEADDDMVPVEIKPGHIRFQPRGKDQAESQNQFPVDTFQWSGTTSKKKGQKWGKERTSSFHKQDGYGQSSQDRPTAHNVGIKLTYDAVVDFEKLTPYTDLPKEGNVIAYRLIELSESWTPELSSFRVGKITKYDGKSNRIWLEPVSDFPFDFRKKTDDDDGVSPAQSDPSPYQEDGSLEADYTSLADVRIVKHGHSDLATVVSSSNALVTPTKETNNSTDEKCAGNQTSVGSWKPQREIHVPAKENGEVNVWDEINEALKAKKAKLSLDNGWGKEDSSGNKSWSQRALRCSALGPTMALLRSQNGL
ncbi:coilin [Cicer arietinum]|uniref:Coilin n=1 Tax=Cicer arietinum TaxID=3827 RepID=A0A1S2YBH9_CICAR|nr:coilin [Cicer arietinum]